MDILFCKKLSIKEGTFILGIKYLEQHNIKVTWHSLTDLLEITTNTARKIGKRLIELGIVEVHLQFHELGGALPSILTVNDDVLKEYLKATE